MALTAGIFEHLEDAEAAREALLAAGFSREQVQLTSRHDEAGPVEGNFLVGNVKEDTLERTEFSETLGGEGDNTYSHNLSRTVDRGLLMLTVDAVDDIQAGNASGILSSHGAADPDRLAAGRGAT